MLILKNYVNPVQTYEKTNLTGGIVFANGVCAHTTRARATNSRKRTAAN